MLWILCLLVSHALPVTDEDDSIRKMRVALLKHDEIAGVRIRATVEGLDSAGMVVFEKVGKRLRYEGDFAVADSAEARKKALLELEKKARDEKIADQWMSFDGRKEISFNAASRSVSIENITSPRMPRLVCALDPANWHRFRQGISYDVFFYALTKEETTNGRCRFRFKGKVDLNEMFIEADQNQGWNITRVETIGGLAGGSVIDIAWAQQDNMWYPKTCTHTIHGEIYEKWEILEIDFRLKSIRTNFGLEEKNLPFGTRIIEKEAGVTKNTRYVGGEEGARTHRLNKGINALKD